MTGDNTPIAARNIKTGGSVVEGYYATDPALHPVAAAHLYRPTSW